MTLDRNRRSVTIPNIRAFGNGDLTELRPMILEQLKGQTIRLVQHEPPSDATMQRYRHLTLALTADDLEILTISTPRSTKRYGLDSFPFATYADQPITINLRVPDVAVLMGRKVPPIELPPISPPTLIRAASKAESVAVTLRAVADSWGTPSGLAPWMGREQLQEAARQLAVLAADLEYLVDRATIQAGDIVIYDELICQVEVAKPQDPLITIYQFSGQVSFAVKREEVRTTDATFDKAQFPQYFPEYA